MEVVHRIELPHERNKDFLVDEELTRLDKAEIDHSSTCRSRGEGAHLARAYGSSLLEKSTAVARRNSMRWDGVVTERRAE